MPRALTVRKNQGDDEKTNESLEYEKNKRKYI